MGRSAQPGAVAQQGLPKSRVLTKNQVMSIDSLSNVKAHLSEIVDAVNGTHERVTITRRGEAVAVLVAPGDLEALEETIALLLEPGALDEIRRGQAEIDAGNYVSGAELASKYVS